MMKKTSRNYGTLLLLVGLFIAPGLSAYLFYLNPQWLSSATTNKGAFLTSSIKIDELGKTDKWRMIFWSPSACDKGCMQQLDKLARVRLAMGRRLYQIECVLMIKKDAPPLSVENEKILSTQDILVKRLLRKEEIELDLFKSRQFFIANSDNELIMVFDENAKPADIFHDMKQLLTIKEK